jgi:hypothetical protein
MPFTKLMHCRRIGSSRLIGRVIFFMKELEQKRDRLTTKSFYIAFETLFIFGVPAVVGVYLGRWIISSYGVGAWVLYFILGSTFILSWVVFLARVKRVSQSIKQVQQEIRELERKDK